MYSHQPVIAHFIKGKYHAISQDENSIGKYLSRDIKENSGTRILLVTEYMDTGNHIKSIGDIIRSQNLPYDVFSIGRSFSTQSYKEKGIIDTDVGVYPTWNYLTFTPNLHKVGFSSGYKVENVSQIVRNGMDQSSFAEIRKEVKIAINTVIDRIFPEIS